jgi:hypothetical protein
MPASQSDSVQISLGQQIAEVKRELAIRERVYQKWVSERRLKRHDADFMMAAMRAVLATLEGLRPADAP